MEEVKKSYIEKLESLFAKTLAVKNRKEFKSVIQDINSLNTHLVVDGLPMVENLPTDDMVDEYPEGELENATLVVSCAIGDTESAIEKL